jgi:GntR family transcriptional regulator/MocR family aminotransferase
MTTQMNVASTDTPRLMFGFSGLSEREADRGTKLLAEAFKM